MNIKDLNISKHYCMKLECGHLYFKMGLLLNKTVAFSTYFSVNAPRILATSNASVKLGSFTWLRCESIYPVILKSPETFWLFNNTILPKESQHYQSMGPNSTTKRLSLRLRISNVSTQDVGWYTCGAKFKIDVVTANVFFSLREEIPRGEVVDKENFSFVEIGFSPVQE